MKDKNSVDWTKICAQMEKWVQQPENVKTPGREWVYEGRKHRIIVEALEICRIINSFAFMESQSFCI